MSAEFAHCTVPKGQQNPVIYIAFSQCHILGFVTCKIPLLVPNCVWNETHNKFLKTPQNSSGLNKIQIYFSIKVQLGSARLVRLSLSWDSSFIGSAFQLSIRLNYQVVGTRH